jgi:hypothetical protein
MDRETRHELDRLLKDFTEALEEVRFSAFDDDREVAAWKKVQVSAWRLNQVLPGLEGRAAWRRHRDHLSIYSELLKLALDEEPPGQESAPSISDLLQSVLVLRARLEAGASSGAKASEEFPAPERLADQLAYDVALVRACQQLGIPQGLAGGGPVAAERERVEQALAEAWPEASGADP